MREKKKRRGYWRGVRERKGGEDRAGELEGKRGEGRGGEEKDENLKVYVTSLLSLISVVLAKLFDNFGLILSSKQIQPALLFFFSFKERWKYSRSIAALQFVLPTPFGTQIKG